MQIRQKLPDNLTSLVLLLGLFTFGIAFISYAWLGIYSRYYADDLCMSGLVVKLGFWQAQVFQYTTWSNRYAGMFTLSLSDIFGTGSIRIWTAVVLFLWLVALAWATGQVLNFLKLSLTKWAVFLLAELAIFFTVLLSPQIYQDLFWRVGILTYTLPLVFLSLIIGILFHQASRFTQGKLPRNGMIALFIITLFAGGFSETYVVLQLSILVLAWLAAFFFARGDSRRQWFALISAGLAGSVLALLLVLLAPGNAARRALMPPPPGLFTLIKTTVSSAFLFMFGMLSSSAFQMLLAFCTPLLIVYVVFHDKKLPGWRPSNVIFAFMAAGALAVILTMAVMAPAAYAQSSYPDGRVLINAAWIMVVMLIVQGVLAGILLAQLHQFANDPAPLVLQVILVSLLAGLLLYPLYIAYKNYKQIPEYSQQAAIWDKRDALILEAKAKGMDEIEVFGMNAPGNLAELTFDSQNWVNVCAAQFYDVKTIVVK